MQGPKDGESEKKKKKSLLEAAACAQKDDDYEQEDEGEEEEEEEYRKAVTLPIVKGLSTILLGPGRTFEFLPLDEVEETLRAVEKGL